MGSAETRLEVTLFGQFALRRGADAVPLPSRPAQALVSYLLLTRGARHRRERLAALLWPDADEENARQNLRNALWKLNKALGPGYLLADKISVGFDPGADVAVDVGVLEADDGDDLEALIGAVGSYGGELLPGFYEEWVLAERERLRAAYDRKVTTLLDGLAASGRWQEMARWAEAWIGVGEAPEEAYRALMRARAALGDTAGMAAAYRRCVKFLENELGLDPSPETQALYARLLDVEASDRPPPAEGSSAAGEPEVRVPAFLQEGPDEIPAPPPVVGREQDLARLDVFLNEALAGRGRVAFVRGEAGRGKTTLTREFARRAGERHPDLVVAVGSCNAHTGTGDPFLPFRDVLSMLLGDVEPRWLAGTISREQARRLWMGVPAAVAALVAQGPALLAGFVPAQILADVASKPREGGAFEHLRTLLGDPRAAVDRRGQNQGWLLESVTRMLTTLAHDRPMILVLEDLHWADASSLGLLFHLGRRLAGSRILLIGTYRPEEARQESGGAGDPLLPILNEFERDFGDVYVDLDRSTDARAFIDSLLDSEANDLDDAFRDRLARLTRGNPLFAVELVQEMKGQGGLWRDDGRWAEGPGLAWELLPARIEGVIRTRIDRLDPALREALTVASIEGERFTVEVVASVLGIEPRDLARSLSAGADRRHHLVESQALRRVGDGRLTTYRFRHALFQRYLYNGLGRVDRAVLHEDVGLALERAHGARAGDVAVELARHFREAGLESRAVPYLVLAGQRALGLAANEEAAAHARQGLDLLAHVPDDRGRERMELDLLLLLGSALQASRGYAAPEVASAFSRAREVSRRMGRPLQGFSAAWSLSLFHTQRAEFEEALVLGDDLLEAAERDGDEGLRLQAHHALWFARLFTGGFAAAREHAEQGIALYDPVRHRDHAIHYGGHDPGVCAHLFAAKALWHLGRPDRALARSLEALALAERLTHPNTLAHAYAHAADVRLLRREGREAQQLAEKAISLAESRGLVHWLAWSTVLRGSALAERGHGDEGIREIRRGLATSDGIAPAERPILLGRLAQAHADRGEVDEGLAVLAEASGAAERLGEGSWNGELLRLRGELLAMRSGADDEVSACFEQALELARRQDAKALELRAATSRVRWFRDAANVRALAELCTWFTEGAGTPDLVEARALLAESPSRPARVEGP